MYWYVLMFTISLLFIINDIEKINNVIVNTFDPLVIKI